MKKYLTNLNIVFAVEIIIVVLASLGLIPREAILFLTGLMAFFIIFSPLEGGLYLTIASIPLFAAMPISDSFDTMADWRILVFILFICLFFRKGISVSLVKDSDGKWRLKENFKHYALEYLILPFLAVAGLSVFIADFKILAIKKLLFFINIFLLFLIIRNLARTRDVLIKILKAAAAGAAVVVAVALVQLITALFVPLYAFWQFWADKIINSLYGQNLAHLLSFSNTWFAYYANRPPTLRLFSVFPDSHSLAMFLILAIPIFLTLAIIYSNEKRKRLFFWLMSILASFCIVLTGSRGAWLSFVAPVCAGLFLYWKKFENILTKKVLSILGIFLALFLLSSFYPPVFYKFQSWQGGESARFSFNFFERAKSISDFDEISNKNRLEIWGASLKSLVRHPVLGVGLGNYFSVLNEDVSVAKKGASAHNLYLDFATEIGIFGAAILILLFVEVLRNSWLVFRRAKSREWRGFGLFFGLYFLWVIVYSLFDVVLLNDKVFLFFIAELGILLSVRSLAEKETANPEVGQR